ncbi:MAG: hypothetical protein U0Q03_22160 [Acidimicrobiales bacterium]
MSWLFDRLCEIAVADHVQVVVAAAHEPGERRDLVEVLARLALVPGAETTVLPAGHAPCTALGPSLQQVELTGPVGADRAPAGASAIVERLLHHATERGLALQLQGARAAVRTIADAHGHAHVADVAHEATALVVATDQADTSGLLRHAGRRGLGISVGGIDPQAAVTMDGFLGVVSILDALATLRGFACSGDRLRDEPPARRIA